MQLAKAASVLEGHHGSSTGSMGGYGYGTPPWKKAKPWQNFGFRRHHRPYLVCQCGGWIFSDRKISECRDCGRPWHRGHAGPQLGAHSEAQQPQGNTDKPIELAALLQQAVELGKDKLDEDAMEMLTNTITKVAKPTVVHPTQGVKALGQEAEKKLKAYRAREAELAQSCTQLEHLEAKLQKAKDNKETAEKAKASAKEEFEQAQRAWEEAKTEPKPGSEKEEKGKEPGEVREPEAEEEEDEGMGIPDEVADLDAESKEKMQELQGRLEELKKERRDFVAACRAKRARTTTGSKSTNVDEVKAKVATLRELAREAAVQLAAAEAEELEAQAAEAQREAVASSQPSS